MAAPSGSGGVKEELPFVAPSADPYLIGVATQSANAFSAAAPGRKFRSRENLRRPYPADFICCSRGCCDHAWWVGSAGLMLKRAEANYELVSSIGATARGGDACDHGHARGHATGVLCRKTTIHECRTSTRRSARRSWRQSWSQCQTHPKLCCTWQRRPNTLFSRTHVLSSPWPQSRSSRSLFRR